MRFKLFLSVGGALGVLALANTALALEIIPPEIITETDSWDWSRWYEDGAVLNANNSWSSSSFDKITLTLVSGALFETSPSGLINWSYTSGWSATTLAAGTFVKATGPSENYLQYDFHLGGSRYDALEFYYSIWSANTLLTIQDVRVNMGGTSWNYIRPGTTAFNDAAALINLKATTPDGGITAALLGISMLGIGWLRRMIK